MHRALETMLSHGLREIPVVDASHNLVGLLDEASIAHAYVRSRQAASPDRAAPHLAVTTAAGAKIEAKARPHLE